MKNKIDLIQDTNARWFRNKKGASLLYGYLVLSVLLTLSAGFALSTASELNNTKRFRDYTKAFWLAEAGVARFRKNQTMLDTTNPVNIYFGSNYVTLLKDDTDSQNRIVTATGHVGSITRQLAITFPAKPPKVFSNTMSSGGNLKLLGLIAKLEVYGPTRLTGTFSKSGIGASGWFEDKQEGISTNETTLKYPDADGNGTSDQFNDFVEFNRDIASNYPPSEVVYIQSDNTQIVIPNRSLAGKKILFVEGSQPGTGNVNILFDASWQSEQNLTVISTGTVEYVQPLQTATNSQLNIIAWDDYKEASILYSSHKGVTYAHDAANFYSIFEYSVTSGNLIANNGINANEALSWKRFDYADPVANGSVPPGFQGLLAQAPPGYATTPDLWEEK